jgi:Zn ribbon nucleic-acid-binding protein
MPIPLTQPCPQCEGELELVTTDDAGEVVVYECPDCGYQLESPVETDEDEPADRPDADEAPDALDEDAIAELPEPSGES